MDCTISKNNALLPNIRELINSTHQKIRTILNTVEWMIALLKSITFFGNIFQWSELLIVKFRGGFYHNASELVATFRANCQPWFYYLTNKLWPVDSTSRLCVSISYSTRMTFPSSRIERTMELPRKDSKMSKYYE